MYPRRSPLCIQGEQNVAVCIGVYVCVDMGQQHIVLCTRVCVHASYNQNFVVCVGRYVCITDNINGHGQMVINIKLNMALTNFLGQIIVFFVPGTVT